MKQKINIFKSAFVAMFVLIIGTGLAIFGGNIGTHLMNQKNTISLFIGLIIIAFVIILWLFAVDYALYKIKKDILSKEQKNPNDFIKSDREDMLSDNGGQKN